MKYLLLIIAVLISTLYLQAQKIESIQFNLYTDSLKKGQHNYINVDGKLTNGKWLPLTSVEINFSSSAGTFKGNDLILPEYFKEEKVKVTAELKSNPSIKKEMIIYIKKNEDPELKTLEEINKKPKKH